ncbi:MAG: patatin-like phospholipase family protein [Bacteroidales bacterium]|nr:patatin-like phospholipase family protein [Bacteroidales bacterium]
MNQKQLYITMFLLMALWLILQRGAWVSPKQPSEKQQTDRIMLRGGPSVQEAIRNKSGKKYALGLALSGGGIKCLCHVGVLKAMDEAGTKPTLISGVSAGAVVGALYADGYSPDSILSLFENIEYSDFFRLEVPDGGLFSLDGFKEFLDTVLRAKTFEELKIPLRIVATDLDGGKSVVFDHGSLVDALVATCSVPILFCPYTINGVNYVDGGVLQNLPASVIRPDCKYLIGVSLGPLKADTYEKSISNIALRSYRFIFRSNANYDKTLCDMVIEPDSISRFNGGDVGRAREIFNIGYREAKRMFGK